MDFLITYGKATVDILIIIIFFYVIMNNLPVRKLRGAIKVILYVAMVWFIADRLLGMPMSGALLGALTQYGFLIIVILYRQEFKEAVEMLGRKRVISRNTENLISTPSRKELAKSIIKLANKKQGAIVVIARESGLDDIILTGVETGDTYVDSNYITMNFHPESKYKNGALIIKDDMIVSVDSRLPLAKTKELVETGAGMRHFAGLGIVREEDCMSIVVSESTGTISIFGKIDGKIQLDYAKRTSDFDLQDGIDYNYILTRIEEYLKEGKVKETKTTKRKKERERNGRERNVKPENKRQRGTTQKQLSSPKRRK